MHRVLIADQSQLLLDAMEIQLHNAYHVMICQDGTRVLEMVNSFDPDILVVDIMMPGLDSRTVLQTLRDAGKMTRVIVTTFATQEYIMVLLGRLGVVNVFTKPCNISSLVACIRDISFSILHPCEDAWYLENMLDDMLLRFGFHLGTQRYNCVYHAVLYRYYEPYSSVTKQLYPAVSKVCGGSSNRIEKAIRDGIHEAFARGNKVIWELYFLPDGTGKLQCPSNDIFIGRLATALRQRSRIKPPADLGLRAAK